MKKKGIILVSGGMDSLVCAAVAASYCDEIYFLHLNYGQKTEARELQSFQQLVAFYKPADTMIVDVSYLKQIGGSSLTDDNIEVKDYTGKAEIPDSYVPFRNAHLVTIAVSWAEVIGADSIYIGAVEEDSSGYPDCRETFYQALEKAVDLGTKDDTKIKLMTPIIHKTKPEIIKLGQDLGVPFHYSWSCYKNNDIACGVCDSCVLRINSFKKAGLKDPIEYAIEIDWNRS
jgi:7-cyano-7-deazaguanine synthase